MKHASPLRGYHPVRNGTGAPQPTYFHPTFVGSEFQTRRPIERQAPFKGRTLFIFDFHLDPLPGPTR